MCLEIQGVVRGWVYQVTFLLEILLLASHIKETVARSERIVRDLLLELYPDCQYSQYLGLQKGQLREAGKRMRGLPLKPK